MEAVSYNLPGSVAEYLPNPGEPIDRWLQMPNASNIRTTAKILTKFGLGAVDAVLDPFAGGGSTAMAARLMRRPFFGIELDPVLACVSIMKSSIGPEHAGWLRRALNEYRTRGSVSTRQNGASDQGYPLLSSCAEVLLETLAQATRAVSPSEMIADVTGAPPSAGSRLIWGDCATMEAWDNLSLNGRHIALYTSPPFGAGSPRLSVPPEVRARAANILQSAALAATDPGFGPFPEFVTLTVEMLRQAADHLPHVTFIIEHEPADDGSDCRADLVDALHGEFGSRLNDLRVLECPAFSWRGHLSLITGELCA